MTRSQSEGSVLQHRLLGSSQNTCPKLCIHLDDNKVHLTPAEAGISLRAPPEMAPSARQGVFFLRTCENYEALILCRFVPSVGWNQVRSRF